MLTGQKTTQQSIFTKFLLKSQEDVFVDIDKLIQKYLWKGNGTGNWKSKDNFGRQVKCIKGYYYAAAIKAEVHWQKDTHTDQRDGIKQEKEAEIDPLSTAN